MVKNLKNMPYAQAKVYVEDNGAVTLVSYKTPVIHIDENGWLTCGGTYSRTTIRHIGAFMREYTVFDYYTAKRAYLNGEMVNIFTGEVKFLE